MARKKKNPEPAVAHELDSPIVLTLVKLELNKLSRHGPGDMSLSKLRILIARIIDGSIAGNAKLLSTLLDLIGPKATLDLGDVDFNIVFRFFLRWRPQIEQELEERKEFFAVTYDYAWLRNVPMELTPWRKNHPQKQKTIAQQPNEPPASDTDTDTDTETDADDHPSLDRTFGYKPPPPYPTASPAVRRF